jgi:glycosyltransferase involved in cell wall biosynthesis
MKFSPKINYLKKVNYLLANLRILTRDDVNREVQELSGYLTEFDPAFRGKQEYLLKKVEDFHSMAPASEAIASNERVATLDSLLRLDGCASLPFRCKGMNQHLKGILNFSKYIEPFEKQSDSGKIDVFFTWGMTQGKGHKLAISAAAEMNRPLIRLEYGFISSEGITLHESPQHSLILCPDVMYYDASQASHMERRLNSWDFDLSPAQRKRAKQCIERIVETRVTKYNHAPIRDIKQSFGDNGRKKILLVDQRYGDQSIQFGLADQSSFERMWLTALKFSDHDVIVKLHPDALIGGKGSALSKVLPDKLPDNVILVDFDINPYCLMEVVDKVFVCVSQLGFEALMAGKEVYCFGVAFYSGWGLTTDMVQMPRPRTVRTLDDLFHVFYIEYSRYFSPAVGHCEIESVIDLFSRPEENDKTKISTALADAPVISILFVLPSGRFGATGRYIQDLAWHLKSIGCRVLVLCEGTEAKEYAGIRWITLQFENNRLSASVREEILKFNPTIIYENGVRSRAQRAALELVLLTGAKLAIQSEDDDIQVYMTRHPQPSNECIRLLDKKNPTIDDFSRFIELNDWKHTLKVWLDPEHDRWVEPVLRAACYHLASLHTAIWYPFEERLKQEYQTPTLVVPPVVTMSKFDPTTLSAAARAESLSSFGVNPESFVLFIAGTIYDYSEEYVLFIEALNELAARHSKVISLVIVSGRTIIRPGEIASRRLNPAVEFLDMGAPDDNAYLAMLKSCDVVCSPGVPDSFNLYRLPSRLVKAMALAKPVLTNDYGFGASLAHGKNALLMSGSDPIQWAREIAPYFDPEKLRLIGQLGRRFAEEHFDAKKVAPRLKDAFARISQ